MCRQKTRVLSRFVVSRRTSFFFLLAGDFANVKRSMLTGHEEKTRHRFDTPSRVQIARPTIHYNLFMEHRILRGAWWCVY